MFGRDVRRFETWDEVCDNNAGAPVRAALAVEIQSLRVTFFRYCPLTEAAFDCPSSSLIWRTA